MSPYNDAAGNRSARRVRDAGRASASRLDAELMALASAYPGRDPVAFASHVRAKSGVAISNAYAADLLGVPEPDRARVQVAGGRFHFSPEYLAQQGGAIAGIPAGD